MTVEQGQIETNSFKGGLDADLNHDLLEILIDRDQELGIRRFFIERQSTLPSSFENAESHHVKDLEERCCVRSESDDAHLCLTEKCHNLSRNVTRAIVHQQHRFFISKGHL
jgi:hypothetical protein